MNTKPLSLLRNPDLFSKLFLVLFCVAWFVFFHWKSLTNDLVINDDNAQHVAWMWQWKANNFQANDPMNLAAETLQQWGYLAVARVAMLVMTPIQFSKYMPLATLLVTCFFTYFLFKKRFGNAIGITAAVLLGFLTMERMTGFNGRAFAFPLLLGFLFYFTERRWAGTAILLVMSALFYPIVLLIELGMLGLEAAYQVFTLRKNGWQQLRSHRKTWLMLSTVVLLSVAIPAIKSRQIANHPLLGHAYSKQELLSLTVFGEDGRVDFAHEM